MAVNPGADGIVVKNWKFDKHIRTGVDNIRNSAVLDDDDEVTPTGVNTPCILPGPDGILDSTKQGNDTDQDGLHAGTAYPYEVTKDAVAQAGAAAQGNDDPGSLFASHFVCKISDKVYDPSYGIGGSQATEATYENEAIDGILDVVMGGPHRCKKNNTGVQELKFTHIDDLE